jgi:hypothetical protein
MSFQNSPNEWTTNYSTNQFSSLTNSSDFSPVNCQCNSCLGLEKSHVNSFLRKLKQTNKRPTILLSDLEKQIASKTASAQIRQSGKQVEEFISLLARNCRTVTNSAYSSDNFSSRLEMQINGNWTTLLSYDCHHGLSFRYVYLPNGKVTPCQLDLPPTVIKQMSQEDFARNWLQYCKAFSTGAYRNL